MGPLSSAGHELVSIKDPSVVYFDGKYHVYATVFDKTVGTYNMVYSNFADWDEAATAPQYYMGQTSGLGGYRCAPQVFYFAPQDLWYLVYQSQPPSYSTTTDLSQPETWSSPKYFIATEPGIVADNKGDGTWIDFWVICNESTCYLFFNDDNGHLYRSRTSIDDFPNGFDTPVIVLSDDRFDLFEACNVYKLKGSDKYLLIVEAIGVTRYFRAWTSDRLDGDWRPLADTQLNPFAGPANVSFDGQPWTYDISHGEFVRDQVDQTMTLDLCDGQYLYQGISPGSSDRYDLLPWKLGVLTLTSSPVIDTGTGGAGTGGAGTGGAGTGTGGAGTGTGGAGGAGAQTFQMSNDEVVIEAEDYDAQTPNGSGKLWQTSSDSLASEGFRLDLTPDVDTYWITDITTTAPRLDYQVNFTSTGTFYFWVRGCGIHGGNDSCWGGMDGVVIAPHFAPNETGSLTWQSRTLNVATQGIHTVSIWGREDGFRLDKIVVNKSSVAPNGTGPAESPQL